MESIISIAGNVWDHVGPGLVLAAVLPVTIVGAVVLSHHILQRAK